jgi:KaiC/GvpD/RAD55 family RecA-like ATPase
MSPARSGTSGLAFGSVGVGTTLYVEGEMDWLAATALAPPGMAVCGLIGGSLPGCIGDKAGERAIIATDADAVGDGLSSELEALLRARGVLIERVKYPNGCKDICDTIAAGDTDLGALLATAKPDGGAAVAMGCTIGALAPGYLDALAARGRGGGPLSTGISTLDTTLGGGLMRGSMCVLSGGVGSGKTSLSLGIALHTAKRGEPAVYLSLEEPELHICDKILRMTAPIDTQVTAFAIVAGERCALELAHKSMPALGELPLLIVGYHERFIGLAIDAAASACVDACRHKYGKPPALIVVDFIQQAANGAKDARGELHILLQRLNTLAARWGLHGLILSQQQRDGRETAHVRTRNGAPELNWSAILGSSQETSRLEQLATQMLVIVREADLASRKQTAPPYGERKRVAVPKNRLWRPMQIVELDFLGRLGRWGYAGELFDWRPNERAQQRPGDGAPRAQQKQSTIPDL